MEVWTNAIECPKALHIQIQPFHGDHFAGNDCHKLLKNIDLLQRLAMSECVFQVFGLIETFQKFGVVVTACFGITLFDNYEEKIAQFHRSYLSLQGIVITSKVHAMFFHVKDFIAMKKIPLASSVNKLSNLCITASRVTGKGIKRTKPIQTMERGLNWVWSISIANTCRVHCS